MPRSDTPFELTERHPVTRIRHRRTADLLHPSGTRTQPLAGFEENFTDIGDYIHQIWVDRAVGRIYETYDANGVVYSSLGTLRSVEDVVAATLQSVHASPDGESHHLNVAWSGDEDEGFYTSHLGFSYSTNVNASVFGPATRRRTGRFFVADYISKNNLIHTEWLMRDNGAAVRHMGFDLHEVAQRLAEAPAIETMMLSPPTRLDGQAVRDGYTGPVDTPQGWIENHFSAWNTRRLDRIAQHYGSSVIAHWCGGRIAYGVRNVMSLIVSLLASLPTGTIRVEHVCWSEETDGVIVAARWTLEGIAKPGGLLGDVPPGRVVGIMGSSHFRFSAGVIVEEWTLFDEVGTLVQIYRN